MHHKHDEREKAQHFMAQTDHFVEDHSAKHKAEHQNSKDLDEANTCRLLKHMHKSTAKEEKMEWVDLKKLCHASIKDTEKEDNLPVLGYNGCPVGKQATLFRGHIAIGGVPCGSANADQIELISAFIGQWTGTDGDYTIHWDFDMASTASVRNKGVANNDLGNQCVLALDYHVKRFNTKSLELSYSETGFLLYSFHDCSITRHIIRIKSNKKGLAPTAPLPTAMHLSPHTQIYLLNPVRHCNTDSGIAHDKQVKELRSKRKGWLSPSGSDLLNAFKAEKNLDARLDVFLDLQTGTTLSQDLSIKKLDDISCSFALYNERKSIRFSQIIGEEKISAVTLVKNATRLVIAPIPALVARPEMKEWDETINNMIGSYKAKIGDVMAITLPPHSTAKAIINFLLCAHANLNEETVFVREAMPEHGDIQVLRYHQTIKDDGTSNPENPVVDLVHEEVGYFVFDWPKQVVTRYGVIPHGSTFAMQGTVEVHYDVSVTVPDSNSVPFFIDSKDGFKIGERCDLGPLSYLFLAGLQKHGSKADKNRDGQAMKFKVADKDVPLNNPSVMLQQINDKQKYERVAHFKLNKCTSMDIRFVNAMGLPRAEPKFIHSFEAQMWLTQNGKDVGLQTLQNLNFDFHINVIGIGGPHTHIFPASFKDVRWPHITVSSLTKQ